MRNGHKYRIMLVLAGMLLVLQGTPALGDMMHSEDVILQWNNVSLTAIQTAQYRATQASRVLAMVHAAMYDSINCIDQNCQPYFVNIAAPQTVSREAAAAGAADRAPPAGLCLRQRRDRPLQRQRRGRSAGGLGAAAPGEPRRLSGGAARASGRRRSPARLRRAFRHRGRPIVRR